MAPERQMEAAQQSHAGWSQSLSVFLTQDLSRHYCSCYVAIAAKYHDLNHSNQLTIPCFFFLVYCLVDKFFNTINISQIVSHRL